MGDSSGLSGKVDDAFARRPRAKRIVDELLARDPEKSEVVGIIGPWGSGKSTFLNFMRNAFDQSMTSESGHHGIAFAFNPWWFSTRDSLLREFFAELGSTFGHSASKRKDLGLRLQQFGSVLSAGSALAGIASYFIPGAAAFRDLADRAGRAAKETGEVAERDQSLDGLYQSLRLELEQARERIWVFVDDVDRLEREEMLAMFALLKSVGALPYIKYVVAVAPEGVEVGLQDSQLARSFMDKVLTDSYFLPSASQGELFKFFKAELYKIPGLQSMEANVGEHVASGFSVLAPLSPTPRHLEKIVKSLRHALITNELLGEIALRDLILLEGIRVLEPSAHKYIQAHRADFLKTGSATDADAPYEALRRHLDPDGESRPDRNEQDHLIGIVRELFLSSTDWQQAVRLGPNRAYDPRILASYFLGNADTQGVSQRRRREVWQELDRDLSELSRVLSSEESDEAYIEALSDFMANLSVLDKEDQRRAQGFLKGFLAWASSATERNVFLEGRVLATVFNSIQNVRESDRASYMAALFNLMRESAPSWLRRGLVTIHSDNKILERYVGWTDALSAFQEQNELDAKSRFDAALDSESLDGFDRYHFLDLLPKWDASTSQAIQEQPDAVMKELGLMALETYRQSTAGDVVAGHLWPLFESDLFEWMLQAAAKVDQELVRSIENDQANLFQKPE